MSKSELIKEQAFEQSNITNRAAAITAITLISVSLLVIAGWLFQIEFLKSLVPGLVPMNPMTALCFIATGVAVWLLRNPKQSTKAPRAVANCLATAVIAVAAIRLIGYAAGWESGIDCLFFLNRLQAESIPNRMAPNTAAAFLLIGLTLKCIDSSIRGFKPGQYIALLASTISFMTLCGYVLHVFNGQRVGTFIPMALHTGVLFGVAAIGTILIRPAGPFSEVILANGNAGRFARRMLLAAVAIPVALEFLEVEGMEFHLFGEPTGIALNLLLNVVIMVGLVYVGSRSLQRTERALTKAEKEAKAAELEAERANMAKSEFLSRMSHELRTPLNSILGFSQLLAREDLSPRQHESLEQIEKGGRHLLQMINEVLDIAKIETGNVSMSLESVEVHPLVMEAITLMRPAAASANVTIYSPQEPSTSLFGHCDRQRLLQVCLNLLSNAIKYNCLEGEVSVELIQIGEGILIEVSDTGSGIPEDKIESLFTPFDRLGAEAKGIEGTGLGLALSRTLLMAMNGSLTYRRGENGGSIFTAGLKVAESQQSQLKRQSLSLTPALQKDYKQATVLLIEDNKSNVELMTRILETRPVTLLVAMQGRLGLELAIKHKPDLILLDLNLPDVHGYEILHLVKSSSAICDIPIVVTSADATQRQIQRIMAEGATDYLSKPLDIKRLLTVIDCALSEVKKVA
ncbi:MAG TPA: ATP-binding protein [Fimbriimonadaceae bacterium]